MVQGQPGQNSPQDPISKITKAKWTGGVTQAVESLLCKCKALSSNPILTKKKKSPLSTSDFFLILYFIESLNQNLPISSV
jgi:hypothetical protein